MSSSLAKTSAEPCAFGASLEEQRWVDRWVRLFGGPALDIRIDGDPRGFVASGHRHWSKRTGKSWLWAREVRRQSGTLSANKDAPLIIGTVAVFQNGTHPDPENVHKLAKDAVFHRAKCGDKHTGGVYAPPLYDKDAPHLRLLAWENPR